MKAYLQVVSVEYDYTDCKSTNFEKTTCAEYVKEKFTNWNFKDRPAWKFCFCEITINISKKIPKSIFFYYKLTNFYQNSRLYVQSVDEKQLKHENYSSSDSDCEPFKTFQVCIQIKLYLFFYLLNINL